MALCPRLITDARSSTLPSHPPLLRCAEPTETNRSPLRFDSTVAASVVRLLRLLLLLAH